MVEDSIPRDIHTRNYLKSSNSRRLANEKLFTHGKWYRITFKLLKVNQIHQKWSRLIRMLSQTGHLQLNKWRLLMLMRKKQNQRKLIDRKIKIQQMVIMGKWGKFTRGILRKNG